MGLGGSLGKAHRDGDLGDRQADEVTQNHGQALVLWQQRHEFGQLAAGLELFDLLLDARLGARLLGGIGHRYLLGSPAGGPNGVAPGVEHDRDEPGPRSQGADARWLVAAEREIGTQKRLRRQLLGLRGPATHPQSNRVHHAFIGSHQLSETDVEIVDQSVEQVSGLLGLRLRTRWRRDDSGLGDRHQATAPFGHA